MQGKSSHRDFISITLLKECSDAFCLIIARLTNLSFKEGSFPSRFKLAQITHLIKSSYLNQEKQWAAGQSLTSTLSSMLQYTWLDWFLTSLPRVLVELSSIGVSSVPFDQDFTLKDCQQHVGSSRARVYNLFVTIKLISSVRHHRPLSPRQEAWTNVQHQYCDTLQSYLIGTLCFIIIREASSTITMSDIGFPQGLCLSPLLASLFTTPISEVISHFGIKFYHYADDMQIYLAVNREK